MAELTSDGDQSKTEELENASLSMSEAIKIAKDWVVTELADENPTNIGVEEIEHNTRHGNWDITLGFSRPWNTTRNALTLVSGEVAVKRVFKVLSVSEKTRSVTAMRTRDKD